MARPTETDQATPDRIVAWLSNAGVAGARQFELFKDSIVCEPHDRADSVFYVQRGHIRIHHFSVVGAERFNAILGPGTWVGVASLAGRPTYSIRARATAHSLIWQLPADMLLKSLGPAPDIAALLIKQLADRVFESYEEASRLVFHGTGQRLVLTLLSFSKSAAAVEQPDGVSLAITHQELAQAIGSARETVSNALNVLREKKLVRTSRNRVTFNPQVLRQFAATQVHNV